MRMPKWKILLVAIGVVGVMVAIPVAVSAVSQTFSDVPPTDWAFDDVEWLADTGVTVGCGGTEYCPDNPVTRREMAAFMHRLADVVTPTVFAVTGGTPGSHGNCATAEFTPSVPQFASFNGGAYGYQEAAGTSYLAAKVEFRVNGGAWMSVAPQYWIYDGANHEDGEMNSPLSGMKHLAAGATYQFAVTVIDSNVTNGGCELNVISQLALLDDTIGGAAPGATAAAASGDANG